MLNKAGHYNLAQESFWDIAQERFNQETKFGDLEKNTNGDLNFQLTILAEEFGEVARAVRESDRPNLRHELIQVAAVSVAMIEIIDRKARKAI